MTVQPLPQRTPSAVVLELDADVASERLAGKACVHCGTRTAPLTYVGWARVATTHPDRHLSCPVSACAACAVRIAR